MKKLFLFFGVISCFFAKAQDIHFTQYYNNPLTLNPANTGNIDGDWRASAIYRSQWAAIKTPFNTFGFNFDVPLEIKDHLLGAGLAVINDKTGINDSTSLNTTGLNFSGSYEYKLKNGHTFRGGLQVGYTFKSIQKDLKTLPSDWNFGTGEFDLGNGTGGLQDNVNYVDFNLGFTWEKKYGDMTPMAGFALFHLNKPTDNFSGSDDGKKNIRINIHGALPWQTSSKLLVTPHIAYNFANLGNQMNVGANLKHDIVHKGKLNIDGIVGGAFRFNGSKFNTGADAAVLALGAQYNDFQIMGTYDFNLSDVKTNRANGSFEISIIYISPSTNPKKFSIPCDRY